MATVSKLPYGTILRYTETRDQPKRTMLVLKDGQLKCLRVGDKTRKGGQLLVTYPSLKAFLDIVPYCGTELFTVEWPSRIDDEQVVAAENYLLTLGSAGESPEGGYVFHREAPPMPAPIPLSSYPPMDMTPPFMAKPNHLAAAPAAEPDYGERSPGGMSGGPWGKPSARADFQEPVPVSPPASPIAAPPSLRIPPPPWEGNAATLDAFKAKAVDPLTTVALTRAQLHRLLVVNGGIGLTPEMWVQLLRDQEGC